ncbi:hypothetical protein D3C75_1191580 [compost metagenome]
MGVHGENCSRCSSGYSSRNSLRLRSASRMRPSTVAWAGRRVPTVTALENTEGGETLAT